MPQLKPITEADRKKYPACSDAVIHCNKLLDSMDRSQIMIALYNPESISFRFLLWALGGTRNAYWVKAQCSLRAFEKGWINQNQLVHLNGCK